MDKAAASKSGQGEVLAATAAGDKAPEGQGYEVALEYAADISQSRNYTAILVLSTIAILILATSATIAVILIKSR